jgi:uncharacterized protein (TIGR02246 family)
MKSMGVGKTWIAVVMAVLCSTLALQSPLRAQTGSPAPATANEEVHAFFLAGVAAFNAHDLEEFLTQFAEDINMYTPQGWLRGHEQVRERFATTFAQFPRVRMEIENLVARQVGKDVVVTDFRWRVYPGGAGPAFHGVGSGVYMRRDGQWREVLEHETVTLVDEALRRPPS